MSAELDPAQIMAEHRGDPYGKCRGCVGVVDSDGDVDLADWPCLPYRLAEALAECEEYPPVLNRQGQLLQGVANALNGPPPPLVSWSHHDLPELAQAAVEALAVERARVRRVEAAIAPCFDPPGFGAICVQTLDPYKIRVALAGDTEGAS